MLVSFMLLNNVSATSVLNSFPQTYCYLVLCGLSIRMALTQYRRLRLSIRLSPILIFSFLINLRQQLFDMWMGEITTDELILIIKP